MRGEFEGLNEIMLPSPEKDADIRQAVGVDDRRLFFALALTCDARAIRRRDERHIGVRMRDNEKNVDSFLVQLHC